MSSPFKDRAAVVSFEARRNERSSADAERTELEELRRGLESERRALAVERSRLEKDRAEFEQDLGVLEDQRRFLDNQRERLRLESAAFGAERDAVARTQAVAAQRGRVESALEDARKTRETDRLRLQAELAGLLPQPPH